MELDQTQHTNGAYAATVAAKEAQIGAMGKNLGELSSVSDIDMSYHVALFVHLVLCSSLYLVLLVFIKAIGSVPGRHRQGAWGGEFRDRASSEWVRRTFGRTGGAT